MRSWELKGLDESLNKIETHGVVINLLEFLQKGPGLSSILDYCNVVLDTQVKYSKKNEV